jgi:phosphoribosyl-ATP pyrophosphohydrolase
MKKSKWVVALADDSAGGYKKGDIMRLIGSYFTDRDGEERHLDINMADGSIGLAKAEYSLKKFEKDIRKFNERCGNVDCTPEMSLAEMCSTVLPQAKVILEEAKELLKACEEQNEQELIDGAVDTCVTTLRLLSLLGKRYDLMKAAQLVMENNHLKYTDDLLLVQRWLAGTTYKMSSTVAKDVKYYCMKDDNGKIRKWQGFPKVELNVEELRK